MVKKRNKLLDAVVAELIVGLTTDGAHHKQYSLEKSLRILVKDEWVEEAKKEFGWETGIPS